MKLLIVQTLTNLRSGLRLAMGRPCELNHFSFGIDQLMALLLLDLILDAFADLILALPVPYFNLYAVPTYTFFKACFFLAIYLLATIFYNGRSIIPMTVMAYSFAPILHFLRWLFAVSAVLTEVELSWLDDLLMIYLAMLFARVMLLVKGNSRFWMLPALLLVALIYGVGQLPFSNYRDFWLGEPEEEQLSADDGYAGYRNMDAESLLYRQQDFLTEKLAGLKPERPAEVELFFVGFAAYAYEDVFVKEVDFIRDLLDQRFHTAGHSINLVNHLSRIDDTPLATATNLSLALKKIGRLMNPEEDVLMLYLTSHGSENSLAVSFWPMALNNVTPKNLNKMLDAAGIKWRIIVVSSCYSGSFVSALQNPFTLIATAAAADRKSFGCGTESDFTYFGEAVFKDQLQRSQPIVTAFKNAITAIARRENEEKLEPSKPQLAVGRDIEGKLRQLEPR